MDIAQGNVTEMADMVPMLQEQFENNLQQLNITEQNALDAHNESGVAQKVCTTFASITSCCCSLLVLVHFLFSSVLR